MGFCEEELIKEWGPNHERDPDLTKREDSSQLLHGAVGQVKMWTIRKIKDYPSQNSQSVKKKRSIPKIHWESVFIRMTVIPKGAPGCLSQNVQHKLSADSFMVTFSIIWVGRILPFLGTPDVTPALSHLLPLLPVQALIAENQDLESWKGDQAVLISNTSGEYPGIPWILTADFTMASIYINCFWFSEIYAPTHWQYTSNFHMHKGEL